MARYRYYRFGIEFAYKDARRKIILHFWRWSVTWD